MNDLYYRFVHNQMYSFALCLSAIVHTYDNFVLEGFSNNSKETYGFLLVLFYSGIVN